MAECRRQILQKKADEKYIEENDEKLQHMNQDTHNAIVALMGSEILEGIESEEGGKIRMESKALQAIQKIYKLLNS